jgi:hypothetical protein
MIPNPMAGITIQWTDSEFFVRNPALALEPLDGDKTGQNLAIAFERILRQFDLWPRVAHITTDEGSDFLNMQRRLAPLLPGFTFDNNGLRCLAHVINNAIHRMFTAMHRRRRKRLGSLVADRNILRTCISCEP